MRAPKTLALTALALAIGAGIRPAAAEDLLEVYELARASDPQLALADASRLAIAEGVVQARSALLPNVSGTASLSDGDNDSTGLDVTIQPDGSVEFGQFRGAQDARTRTYRVQLLQSIYDHANYTRLRSSKATRSRAEADYEAALDLLFTRVALTYFTALNNTSNVDALRAEENAVGRQLEQAEQRFEVGLTAITDVHEARARFDSARANRILAENQLNDSYEALAELTGKRIESLEPLREDIPLALPEPADPQAWVDVALQENAVLESRRYALEASEHDIGTAKAGHLPSLGASISGLDQASWGDRSSNDFTFPVDSTFEDTSIGLQLTVPIFEGFATQSRVRQAVYNRDAAQDLLEQDRRAVERTTRNTYRAVVAGVSEVEARRQALVSAQSALEATQAGFEVGTRTIVDVLISQQQLYAAQREYARARHLFIVNGLNLKQSAGTISVDDLQEVNALLDPSAVVTPVQTDDATDDPISAPGDGDDGDRERDDEISAPGDGADATPDA